MNTRPRPKYVRVAARAACAAALAVPLISSPSPALEASASVQTAVVESGKSWYVSPTGDDAAAGTAGAPVEHVQTAIDRARTGDVVVLGGGTYHESVNIWRSGLTLRAAAGADVRFDGSERVTGFQARGSTWVRTGWNHLFDHSPTYTQGAPDGTTEHWTWVNAAHPMAAWPDQVWVGGKRMQQVRSASEVGPGRFAVDYDRRELIIGDNPVGTEVRASTLQKALSVSGAASKLEGFDVTRYANSVPIQGVVTLTGPDSVMRDVSVTENATSGILIHADRLKLIDVTANDNGLNGIHGSGNDDLLLDRVEVRSNNSEHFNRSPAGPGIKITASRGVTVRDSVIVGNDGTGLWLDESVYDFTVTGNRIANNQGHGMSLEISDKGVVADNTVVGSGGYGVKVNNTGNVALWNNTIVNSEIPVNMVQDSRDASNRSTPGHDDRRPFPDPTMPWLVANVQLGNNVLSVARVECVVCLRDSTGRRTAEQMNVDLDGNAYYRTSSSNPRALAVWGNYSRWFPTVETFRAATGNEQHGTLTAQPIVRSDGQPLEGFDRVARDVSVPIPTAVANLIGVPAGARHLGAVLTSLNETPPASPAPVVLARDSFGRSVSNGWGTADLGGLWSRLGSGPDFAVGSGTGRITMSRPGSGPRVNLYDVSSTDTEMTVTARADKAATGGVYLTARPRVISAEEGYWATVRLTPDGSAYLQLKQRVGNTNSLLAGQVVSGLDVRAIDGVRIKAQAFGTSPTTFRAKVWKDGTAEPQAWTASVTDSSPTLQVAGGVGLGTYLSGSATNAPVTASFSNLEVRPTP